MKKTKVEKWQALEAARLEAEKRHRETQRSDVVVTGQPRRPDVALDVRLEAEIEHLRLEAEAARAAIEADVELHVADVQAGKPEALACDLPRVVEQLEQLEAERRAAQARLDECVRAIRKELAAASDARERYATSRAAAGLPAPARIPQPKTSAVVPVITDAARIKAIRERIETGPPEAQPKARLRIAEGELRAERLRLERVARELEEQKERDAQFERRRAQGEADEARRRAAEHEATVEKRRRLKEEEEELLASFEKRRQGATP